MRNAVNHLGWLPVVSLLVLLWTVVVAIDVVGTMQAYGGLGSEYVGQTFVGGAIGLLVLFGFALSVVYLYGEMGETEPAPESFPPQ